MKFKLLIWMLYSLLSITEQVTAEIFCSSEPVSAFCGSSVVLQCHLEPQLDATHNTVKWSQGSNVVHIRQDGKDKPGEQKETFEGRTSLFSDELSGGNLSLRLSNLKLTDSGRYKCSFHDGSEKKSCHLSLAVGESEVIGSSEVVKAKLGANIILPCHLEPPFDVTTLTVEWKYNGTSVHVHRSQKDNLDDQDKRFTNRTSLFHDEMKNGSISLKLRNVTKEDAGIYICFLPGLNCQVKRGNITLVVESGHEDPEKKEVDYLPSTQSTSPPDQDVKNAGLIKDQLTIGLSVALGIAVIAAIVIVYVKLWKPRQTHIKLCQSMMGSRRTMMGYDVDEPVYNSAI